MCVCVRVCVRACVRVCACLYEIESVRDPCVLTLKRMLSIQFEGEGDCVCDRACVWDGEARRSSFGKDAKPQATVRKFSLRLITSLF